MQLQIGDRMTMASNRVGGAGAVTTAEEGKR
jgi:hypothetical protein